jgi:hypothetical protein
MNNRCTDRKALADRLEACVKQIGQPDYSLGDLYRDCLEIAADMRGLPSLSGPVDEARELLVRALDRMEMYDPHTQVREDIEDYLERSSRSATEDKG